MFRSKWAGALLACWLVASGVRAQAQFTPSTYGTVLSDVNPAAQGTHANGDNLTALVASTGPGWTATGAGATYKTNASPTGQPAIHTTGNATDCRFSANSNISASTGSYTIAWVGSITVSGTTSWIFDTQTGRDVLLAYDGNAGGKTGFFAGAFNGVFNVPTGTHSHVITLNGAASTGTYYLDNVSQGTFSYTSAAISGTTVLFGASDMALSSNFTGDTDRFIIYSGVLSSGNLASLNTAISTTYINAASSATAFTLTGPALGSPNTASTNFTVTPNAALSAAETVTPSDGGAGGTFSPASLSFASSATGGQTFTYTPNNAHANTTVTLTATASPALGTAPTASYAVGALLIYTRVDATDPIMGYTLMVLVPNGNATNPYNSANPTKLILYFHGAGESVDALLTDANKAGCVTAFLNAGYILAASTGGGTNTWGNQASVDGYAGCWKYCTNNYNISKTALWGQSMGGLASLLSLSEGKIKDVVGWLGTYPVCSLANLYSLGTYAPNINAAYGITGSGTATYANLTTGQDPALKWGWAFRRVPMQIYASYGDTIVPRANNTDALATLVSGSASVTVITCTGDHGDPSHFQPASYLTFVNNCFSSPPQTSGSTGGTKRRVQ